MLDAPHVIASAMDALARVCELPLGSPIVAACSGGADSVALVYALGSLSATYPLVAVVFIDHGLRDVSAEREAARQAADRANAPFVVRTIDASSFEGNLQAAARAARYEALYAAAPADAFIATGHTADDQTETLLHRLVRGTGVRGLAGIWPREGRLIRPLLKITRATTRALGLPFADDPTNDTARYLRNRLRAEVVPHLLTENPALHEATAQLRDAAVGEFALVEALLRREALRASCPPLIELDALTLGALLRHLVHQVAPQEPPTHAATQTLAQAIARRQARAGVSLGNGFRGVWRDGKLRIAPDTDPRRLCRLVGTGHAYGFGYALEVSQRTTNEQDSGWDGGWARPRGTVFPITVVKSADSLYGPLEFRDREGVLLWPGTPPVSTLRKVEPNIDVFSVRIARLPTLVVERDGQIRLSSDGSAPQTRLGR